MEQLLRPAFLDDVKSQTQQFIKDPVENSPQVGFNILIVPSEVGQQRRFDDVTFLAAKTQQAISNIIGSDPTLPNLEMKSTFTNYFHMPQFFEGEPSNEPSIFLAPTHLNIRPGSAADQQKAILDHNNNHKKKTILSPASNLQAMYQIAFLVSAGLVSPEGTNLDRYYGSTFANPFEAKVKEVKKSKTDKSVVYTRESIPELAINANGIIFGKQSIQGEGTRALVSPKKHIYHNQFPRNKKHNN